MNMNYGEALSRLYLWHEHQLRFVIKFERYLCDCIQLQDAMVSNDDHHLRDSLRLMVLEEPTNDLQLLTVRPLIVRLFDIHSLKRASYYHRLNLLEFFVPNFEWSDWHHVVIKLLNGTKWRKRRNNKTNETEKLCKMKLNVVFWKIDFLQLYIAY